MFSNPTTAPALGNVLKFIETLPSPMRRAILDAARSGDAALVSRLLFPHVGVCFAEGLRNQSRRPVGKHLTRRFQVPVTKGYEQPVLVFG